MRKRVLAMLLVLLMVGGVSPLDALAQLHWPVMPDGAVSSWVGSGLCAVRSAVSWLGERLHGLSMRASAKAYSGTCGDDLTWVFDTDTGVLTISGTGAMNDYDYVNSVPWYFYRSSIQTVIIASCATSIRNYAFDGCTGLASITIPESVTSIGYGAFSGCTGLVSMTLPFVGLSADATGKDAVFSAIFWHYRSMIDDEYDLVPDSGGFADPIGVGGIPFSPRRVTLTSCTSIPRNAFDNCAMLTEITLPESVTSIGESAFYGCTGLTSITIPDGVTSICSGAFSRCMGLTSITIPESVTSIENDTFQCCTGLASITIPDSVTSIGERAFYGCTGLSSITIPDGVTSIGEDAFYECTGLTSITIPDGVTTIGEWAFCDCTGLTSITIPDSVTRIGEDAFYGCTGLTSLIFNAVNCSLKYGGTFSGCTALESVTFGENVQTIPNILSGCTGLTSITIPDSVTSIGTSAFSRCTGLTSITIPDSVTSIGSYAFSNCTSLERVDVGESVQSIGAGAFSNCSALRRVLFHGDKARITDDAFLNCGDYALCCTENSYWQLYAMRKGIRYILTDEADATEFEIENGVLLGCAGAVAKITVPSCVTAIDFEAFCGNDTVTRIALPQSVSTVGNYAFADCACLAEVFIPDSVTSIGADAFRGSNPAVLCVENSYAHRYAVSHNMTVKFVRILIDLENAVMRVEIPYEDEPEVSLVHLTGVSLQVVGLGSLPKKTVYRVGETLETDGLSLEAHYTNGMTSILREGFSVSQPIFSAPGEQTVTLGYCGQTVELTVTVTDEVVSGDADRSGTLDLVDVALITRCLAGGWDVDLSDVDVDVNKDGEVNLIDAAILRRFLAGGWGVRLA